MNDTLIDRSPDRHSARRWLLGAVAVVLLAGLLAVAVWADVEVAAKAKQRRVVLADGTRVEFLGTALGTATFTSEQPWQRAARRILPARLTKWIPAALTGSTCTGSTNGLTVFLKITTAASTAPGASPFATYAAEDATDFRYFGGGFCSMGQLYALTLGAFPRREAEFTFLLLDNHDGVLGKFRVLNPIPGPFPEWTPAPLPQTVTNGPAALTLLGLEREGTARWPYLYERWKLEPSDPHWAQAQIRRWSPLFDATGNEIHGYGTPSPREPAWKVRALLERQNREEFGPSDKVAVTNLSVPAAGNFVALDRSNTVAGAGLRVVLLSGPGCVMFSNSATWCMPPAMQATTGYSVLYFGTNAASPSWGNATPFFLVEATHLRTDDVLEFFMRDDAGLEMVAKSDGDYGLNGARYFQVPFTMRAGAKRVDFEVALNRPLAFDFLVSPKDVQPAGR